MVNCQHCSQQLHVLRLRLGPFHAVQRLGQLCSIATQLFAKSPAQEDYVKNKNHVVLNYLTTFCVVHSYNVCTHTRTLSIIVSWVIVTHIHMYVHTCTNIHVCMCVHALVSCYYGDFSALSWKYSQIHSRHWAQVWQSRILSGYAHTHETW